MNKRKEITDFFSPDSKRVKRPTSKCQVPGLEIRQAFITPAEESSILSFLSTQNFRTDLQRRCLHFGGTYCLFSADKTTKPEVLQADPMPVELEWLIDRFVAQGVFEADKRPQYCIVNEYVGSQGISAHTENFSFGEPVVGLSLLSSCSMRFIELSKADGGSVRSGKAAQAEKTGKKVDVVLPGRSLCVMRGKSRYSWQHEILRSAKGRGEGWKRVSLTFRWKEE